MADLQEELPSVVISIDFEMRWGVHDIYGMNFNGYRNNLENCRSAVLSTLQALVQRNLKATWAAVGALGLNDWDEYFSFAPPPPKYLNSKLAVRKEYADIDPSGYLHFAPDLISEIVQTTGQELGSHSFSHLYFREPGVTSADFIADMMAVARLWRARFGVTPVSLVFPRNQSAFVDQLDGAGIRVWRDTEPAWFYDCNEQGKNTILPRTLRFVDSINPWTSRVSQIEKGVTRASLFVRFDLPNVLWRIQIKRIKRELKNLVAGEVFHLWWHPHNLGFDLAIGTARLVQVLDLIAEVCVKNKASSKTMKDFAYNERSSVLSL
ncbi:MAG: polysaccharide deacetylase family protein [Gammaproteobacteria bacterium]|nr:polysaccharide deacetylase family protein [Gammaproteobacteria bacterium]